MADVEHETAPAPALPITAPPMAAGTAATPLPMPPDAAPDSAPAREVMYRHSITVRITHWANVVFLTLLLMSGLCIFNYHPSLYWGNYGYRGVPAFLSIAALEDIETDEPVGVTTIAGHRFITTGVLGLSYNAEGAPVG